MPRIATREVGAVNLGARQSVRALRAGHDNPAALAVRLVAPGGTNVGSRPGRAVARSEGVH